MVQSKSNNNNTNNNYFSSFFRDGLNMSRIPVSEIVDPATGVWKGNLRTYIVNIRGDYITTFVRQVDGTILSTNLYYETPAIDKALTDTLNSPNYVAANCKDWTVFRDVKTNLVAEIRINPRPNDAAIDALYKAGLRDGPFIKKPG